MIRLDPVRYSLYRKLFLSVVAFLAVTYTPGLIFSLFFQEYFYEYYAGFSYHFFLLFCFVLIFFSSFFIVFKFSGAVPVLKLPFIDSKVVFLIISALIILYFFACVYFNLNFSAKFRHVNRLSDAGPIVIVLWVLKQLMSVFLLSVIIVVCNGNELNLKTKIFLLLMAVGAFLSITSSLQILFPVIVLVVVFFPSLLIKKMSNVSLKTVMLLIFIVPASLVMVLFVGAASKLGYDQVFSERGFDYIWSYRNVIIPRVSTSYASLMAMIDSLWYTNSFEYDSIKSISDTFQNRLLSVLDPFYFDKSSIDTINRFNYLHVFANHAERAGASPGILASTFYFPFYPLGFVAIPLFLCVLIRCIYRFVQNQFDINAISALVIPYLLMNLFEAPLNIFYVLDPLFVIFIFLFIFSCLVNVNKVFSKCH